MEIACNGCTVCCQGSARLTDAEADRLESMVHPGGWIGTALTADGWCVYCDQDVGCLIHETKPKFCAEYDCAGDVENQEVIDDVRRAARDRLKRMESKS